jgi:hypothetical protein
VITEPQLSLVSVEAELSVSENGQITEALEALAVTGLSVIPFRVAGNSAKALAIASTARVCQPVTLARGVAYASVWITSRKVREYLSLI